MRRFVDIAKKAYTAGLVAAPVIGANYNVWTHHDSKYTLREFAIDTVSGAFCGAVFGILSPIVVLGIPAYVAVTVTK